MFALDRSINFPPVHLSEPDGLLAIGGDLSKDRLLAAYQLGIFPWYEGPEILWWCPDPRFILFPAELKISKTMKSLIRKGHFTFTVNKAFGEVINNCRGVSRRGQDGTWISDEVLKAYTALHGDGYAHSAEAWLDGKLVGGLYGIRMGNVFFGESMFSLVSNASKFAFINYVETLKAEGIQLIDCQVYTQHLESLGARMIPRKDFVEMLNQLITAGTQNFDPR
ncbi:MAG: leucyl/phenylalanyl-tRNA--protein transferase [Chitinophagaceae bacterium]|nr:MAG: leucyl/phenylalanyl-tRNA--protein transferase [Chitinophagaceae bacterium]